MRWHHYEPADTDTAIIAMVGRFPGADTPDELWSNVIGGGGSITFLSDDELAHLAIDQKMLRDPGCVPAAPVLKDATRFDSGFFSYLPREGRVMGPQQRIFLECAWETLGHLSAAIGPGRSRPGAAPTEAAAECVEGEL